MRLEPIPLEGAYLVHRDRHSDERGSFERVSCTDEFTTAALNADWAQTSISRNPARGTLRGLHYSLGPEPEIKLITCLSGRIYDVVADLRPGSASCGRWYGAELSPDESASLYVPHGLAHGFVTLEPDSSVLYQISALYDPAAAAGVAWDDPTLAIDWPVSPQVMSARDKQWPGFEAIMAAG
jgi:dTDP-4-dehydrorhamnose 3,5-epimerase